MNEVWYMGMVGRRGFIGAAGAFAAAAQGRASSATAQDPGRERMRFGVLSDIHVTTKKQLPILEKALRKLDSWKVDGVLVSGDLADFGLEQQLQLIADTWFKVFPDGKAADGRPVTNLMHYGDHDMSQSYWDLEDARRAWPSADERRKGVIFDGDRKAVWERCFREPWVPIQLKTVKGYDFVLSHFTRGEPGNKYGHVTPGLESFFASHTFDPSKPFFYSQHRVPRGSVLGPTAANLDEGRSTAIFSKHPNLIAFCGHCHTTCSFEKSIWQGEFTCIQVPSLRYCCTMGGRENGYCSQDRVPPSPPRPVKTMLQHPSGHTHQGMLCMVCDNAVVLRRWEFKYDVQMGPDWVIPLSSFSQPASERPFAYDVRVRTEPVPQFPEGAAVKLSQTKAKDRAGTLRDMIAVDFPPALHPRANDYEVTVELRQGDIERILLQKRVYSPRYLYGESMETEPVRCLFTDEEIPPGWTVRYVVRPMNAFGVRGRPLATAFAVAGASRG